MKSIHVPTIDAKYWTALIIASVFGADSGDFLSNVVGLGHFSGLPVLAAVFIAIFIAERFDRWKHPVYFWATIIVVRTAATNIGDISSDDLHWLRPWTILALAAAMVITGLIWNQYNRRKNLDRSTTLATVPVYWWTMLLAGTLGTVIGDFCSYNLPNLLAGKGLEAHWVHAAGGDDAPAAFNLNNLWATILLGVPVAILLFFSRKPGRTTNLLYYWATVVLIRSTGTAAGDFFSHGPIGLPVSLAASGVVFVAALIFLPSKRLAWKQESCA